ncbi:MAG TPA: DUF2520 domain-containing protein [Parafilimonas sp.]|nr:DUF2520 domain-containing protein [Parafilimonas sp.]
MKISFIGSGNVATVLGRLLKQKNFIINEVVSRDKTHALHLAKELDAIAIDDIKALSKNSDVYIIAVNDGAIEAVSNQLNTSEKIVVHTCGSASINLLRNASKNFGVLYPLQSLRKEISYLSAIPFLIDASNNYSKNVIITLAEAISDNIKEANDEQRMQYHLAAIVVSNFTNHLFALAQEYCIANKIEFSLLLPLIEEVINRLKSFKPAEMQTGPAIRGDISTIQKHLSLLKDFPQLKNIYEVMSESIAEVKCEM